MVDAINSTQMVQQAMKMRGFGRRHGVEGGASAGGWPTDGLPPEHHQHTQGEGQERMQAFAAKYGRGLPEGLGQGMGGFRPEGFGGPRMSVADGKPRPERQAFQNNPQMAAAMEALKQVLDQSQNASDEDRQSQLVSWANAYNVPVPEPGSKWFWEA